VSWLSYGASVANGIVTAKVCGKFVNPATSAVLGALSLYFEVTIAGKVFTYSDIAFNLGSVIFSGD
jgi:hypothetical protein